MNFLKPKYLLMLLVLFTSSTVFALCCSFGDSNGNGIDDCEESLGCCLSIPAPICPAGTVLGCTLGLYIKCTPILPPPPPGICTTQTVETVITTIPISLVLSNDESGCAGGTGGYTEVIIRSLPHTFDGPPPAPALTPITTPTNLNSLPITIQHKYQKL